MANELNRQFSKEVQMANKYTKKGSTFLVIKEMQVKTTEISPHPRKNGCHQRTQRTNAGEDGGRDAVGGNVN
jgi:hypothetical protein